jgi:hypothetical protein
LFRENKSCLSSGKQDRESRNPNTRGKDINNKIMKILDLKIGSIKEMLTKDQMKLISGGSCTWYWSSAPDCVGGTSTSGGSQQGADNNCNSNDCCDNVDCV